MGVAKTYTDSCLFYALGFGYRIAITDKAVSLAIKENNKTMPIIETKNKILQIKKSFWPPDLDRNKAFIQ